MVNVCVSPRGGDPAALAENAAAINKPLKSAAVPRKRQK
jgi:hypothetical protein